MIKTVAYGNPNIEPDLYLNLLHEKYKLFCHNEIINLNFIGSIQLTKIDRVDIDISEKLSLEYFTKILNSISNVCVVITNWNDTPRDTLYQKSFRKSIINNVNYILLTNGCKLIYMLVSQDNNVINNKSNVFEGIKQFSTEDFYLDADYNVWHKKNQAIHDVDTYEHSMFVVGEK